jgi:hypothetical protein
MQRVTLVRYTTKPEQTSQNEALARAVFTEVNQTSPKEVAYALFKNDHEFIHVFVNLKEDEAASVTDLPSFIRFQDAIADRCEIPPQVTRVAAELIESYGFTARRP